MYGSAYDQSSSRSPGSHRNQQQSSTLNRMPSRQFDAYAPLPQGNPYTSEDHIRGYEQQQQAPRNYDRQNQTMHAGGYGYDMGATAGWNANAFSQNPSLGPFGGPAAARLKSQSRGRAALPSVRNLSSSHAQTTLTHVARDGWINSPRACLLTSPCPVSVMEAPARY
jgi:hypothetical protein